MHGVVTCLLSDARRAVDELYNLCEDDSNLPRAKEAMALLQRCANDFEKVLCLCFAVAAGEEEYTHSVCTCICATAGG